MPRLNFHEPSSCEILELTGKRIYHSSSYGIVYAMVLLVNVGLILWLVKDKGRPQPFELFVILEACVTAALVTEILVTARTQGLSQWINELSNWFDFLVAVVCVFSLGASAFGEHPQEEVAVLITSVRYGAQALRFGVLLKHMRRKGPHELEDIQMDDMDSEIGEASSPPMDTGWGRGRAHSTSPIFKPSRSVSDESEEQERV